MLVTKADLIGGFNESFEALGKDERDQVWGFTLAPGEKVLIAEDVVTRGGRVLECLEIIRQAGGTAQAIAMLVDRSAGVARFAVPAVSLLELSFPTYPADAVPEALARIPVTKPGS